MKQARFQLRTFIASVLFLGLALAAACGGSEKQKKDSLVEADIPNPPFLADIPADTPFALVSLEALPVGQVLDQMKHMFRSYDEMVAMAEKELARSSSPDGKQALEVMKLFQGKYTRAGMSEIGMSMAPRAALYGIGFYPVMRLELADTQKFKNFVDKVANVTGAPLQSTKRGEMEYQYIQDGDARVFVSYRGKEVHVGLTEPAAEATYLPYYFGEKKPANPISKKNVFEEVKEEYGFLGFAVGFIDFEQIAAAMVEPTPGLNGETWVMASDSQPRSFTPECQREIKSIAANFPRIVGGYTQFDETAMAFRAGLETRTSLGTDLAATRSPIPAYENAALGDSIFQAGAGISIQGLLQTVQAHAASIRETPYQCQDLAMLNQWAQQSAQVGMMVPPAMSQLRGLHIAVTGVNLEPKAQANVGKAEVIEEVQQPEGDEAVEEQPSADREADDKPTKEEFSPDEPIGGASMTPSFSVDGFAFISTAAPEQLVESLALFMPELGQLQMKPDGTPRPLPAINGTEILVAPHAVMTQHGIAISSGEGSHTVAADALAAAPSGDSPMLMLKYNLSELKALLENAPEEASLIEPFLSQGPATISVDPEDRGIFMEMNYRWSDTD